MDPFQQSGTLCSNGACTEITQTSPPSLCHDRARGNVKSGSFGCEKCLTEGLSLQRRRSRVLLRLMPSCTDSVLLLLVAVFMPGETFLIESYDNLWTLMIGLLGKNEISLVGVFPARDEDGFKIISIASNLHTHMLGL